MATQTLDSHQPSTSDEQTVKLSSEAVKVTEQINFSSPQETEEDDREKGKADNLHIPDSTLSTSEEKAVDIQVEPPVVDFPLYDNVKLEKESIFVEEVATAADETVHEETPSSEPVGGEATELPVIAYLKRSIKEFDATDNVKIPPEDQITEEVIEPTAASAKKVEEQPSETVDSQEKEKPGAGVQSIIEVEEKVEIVPLSVEEVEEKKPKIIDNPELSVVADSGKGPAEAEEEPATEFVSVEKEPNKEPETGVQEESVELPKKEAQPIEVVPVEEPIEVVAREIIGTVEPPAEKKQPLEVHPIQALAEVITKELGEPIEVSKEKEQASEVEPGQESRESKISESVEVPQKSELLVEVHPTKVVIEKETNESVEPLKNKEQPDEVISQKESVEVIVKEVSGSFEPPKNEEQADEGFSVTESGELKEKETNDSTLGSEEVEKRENEVIEVKDGIGELTERTKHVQDTYVEVETVKDEKPLAPGDDIAPPIEEEGSDKQDSVGQMAESGLIEDSVKGPEKEQTATEFVSEEKEPKEVPLPDTTCVPEESVEPPKKEVQPSEALPEKEPVELVAKEVIETLAPPTEKEQPEKVAKVISEVVAKEFIETVEPPTEKQQQVVIAKGISEMVAKEVVDAIEPPTEEEQPIVTAKEIREVVAKEVTDAIEPPSEEEQPIVIAEKVNEVVAKEVTDAIKPPTKEEQPVVIAEEISEVVANEAIDAVEPQTEEEQPVVIAKEISEVVAKEGIDVVEPPTEEQQPVVIAKETSEVVTKEVIDVVEPPMEEKQPVVLAKEISEVVAKEVIDAVEPPTEEDKPIVIAKEISEVVAKEVIDAVEPPTEEDKPIVIAKEINEVVAKEVIDAVEPSTEEKQPIVIANEISEVVAKVIDVVEPLTKEEQPIVTAKEISEVVAKEVIDVVEPPTKEEQLVVISKEISDVVAKEAIDAVEPPKEEDQPVVIAKEISEVVAKEVIHAVEPPTEEDQPVVIAKEISEVVAKEVIESIEPPKNKEQPAEVVSQTESLEVIAKEESVRELLEITKHVQDTYVELETVIDEKALAPEDDTNPPIEGEKNQEEETQYKVESDKQVSEGQVVDSVLVEDHGKGIEKEQRAEEFVSVDKEPRKEPKKTCVPELSVEPPKKEEPIEVLPAEEVKVIEKEIIEVVELLIEREPTGVHSPKRSEEVVEKEIIEPTKLPKEMKQATEAQQVQESKEVLTSKIGESVEIPKENELLIEVQPVKLEVVAEDTSESIEHRNNQEQPNEVSPQLEVIAKEISESFVPPKESEQANDGFPVTGSEDVGEKETNDSKLGPEEVEKQDLEVTELKDSKEELPAITNKVRNDYVEVENEPIEKGESGKGEKSLALRDDSTPPLKEEEQCTEESDRHDSLGHGTLVVGDFSSQDVKEDEKKESSNINGVAKSTEGEAPAVEKVREEIKEKTETTDEDKYEKIEELTLAREEMTPRDFETDAVVVEKSIDDQKAGEGVDLIAETKIEGSITDDKPGLVEIGNVYVNETRKEPQESELEVKDKETVITGEVPKVNDKKEVPSKPSHKHSHNLLSKVKQSLVKAKKAIIGKSPSSKTLSSETRDDIKVK